MWGRKKEVEIDVDIESISESRLLRHILHIERRILATLESQVQQKKFSVEIKQIIGGKAMSITGTPVGGQSTFEADAILNGIADPAGFPAGSVDTWTVDDPAATVGPDSGPSSSQVVVSIPATDTQGSAPSGSPPSYNLTVSVSMPGSTSPLTMTVNVPITPAPVPVPTAVAINQVS
jgi:hypothetical protein